MRWLILLMLLPFCAFAQKPDYIRTPNGPNTIVDWNVKFKTLIVPHGGLLTLAGSQDSTGHLYLLVTPSDTSLYFYVRGKGWLLNRTSVTGASVIAALGYTPLASEVDPLVPNYAKSLTAFSVIKGSTDPLYQPVGSYYIQSQVNALLAGKQATLTTGATTQYLRGDLSLATFPTAVSAFTNDAGYLTGSHVTSFNTRTGAVVPLTGDYSAFYYPLSGNPSAFLTTEVDPTVPAYSKSLTAFSVIKSATDLLYYPSPTGTTAQYVRGNGTLATFPTAVSSFSNDAGYLTNSTGDARYPQLSGAYVNPTWITSLPYTKITGTPTFATLSNGLGIASLSYTTAANASIVVDTTVIKSKASALSDYNNVVTSLSNKQPLENQRVSTSNSPTFANVTTIGTYTGQLAFSHIPGYGLTAGNFTNLANVTTSVDSTSAGGVVSKARANANYVYLFGTYSNPIWITALAWSKITGTPTTLAGYGLSTDFNTIGDARYVKLSGSTSTGNQTFANTFGIVGTNASGVVFNLLRTTSGNDIVAGAAVASGTYGKYRYFAGSGNETFNILSTGAVIIKVSGTLTDGGYFLDVQSAGTNGYLKAGNFSVNASGNPLAPTASAANNSTQVATTAYVDRPLLDNQLLKTSSYTIVAGDFAVDHNTTLDLHVDATAGAVVITMPSATTLKGYTIYITRDDAIVANTITINTVLGGNLLTTQYQSRSFKTDLAGSNWYNH